MDVSRWTYVACMGLKPFLAECLDVKRCLAQGGYADVFLRANLLSQPVPVPCCISSQTAERKPQKRQVRGGDRWEATDGLGQENGRVGWMEGVRVASRLETRAIALSLLCCGQWIHRIPQSGAESSICLALPFCFALFCSVFLICALSMRSLLFIRSHAPGDNSEARTPCEIGDTVIAGLLRLSFTTTLHCHCHCKSMVMGLAITVRVQYSTYSVLHR